MLMRYLFFLATVILSTSIQAGSIHKWVDEDGNVHYGDAPPVTAKTESVRVQSAPSNPGRALPRLNNQGTQAGGTQAGGAPATANADDAGNVPKDQAKIACDQAQQDLKVIKGSSRVKLRSADGSTRYMTTEEIDQRRQQAEADIARFCQ